MSGKNGIRDGGSRLGEVVSGLVVAVGCVLFLGGFGWGAVQYRPYTVPTGSMEPAITAGDRVLAQRIDGSEVRRGDVVVFTDTLWGDVPMVKRVVAVGGDKITCCSKQGLLTINGKALEEPYLKKDEFAALSEFTATVPDGELFLLGDNRSQSLDSRLHLDDGDDGAVPRDDVTARVDATVWPAGRTGMLDRTSASSAFAALPGGVSRPGPLGRCVLVLSAGALLIFLGSAYGPVARRFTRRAG